MWQIKKLSQILPCPFYFDYRCYSIFLSASLVRMYERKRKIRAFVSFSCGLAAAWGIWKLGTTCVVAKLVHLSHSCFDIHLLPVTFFSIASTIASVVLRFISRTTVTIGGLCGYWTSWCFRIHFTRLRSSPVKSEPGMERCRKTNLIVGVDRD